MELKNKKASFAERLKRRKEQISCDIPAVFLALRRKETPVRAKILAGLTIVYALSPMDFIPDFIPVLGYLDDLIILPGLAAAALKKIPTDILDDCRREAAGMWENGRPKKWYYAVPFVLLWLIILLLIVKAVFLE